MPGRLSRPAPAVLAIVALAGLTGAASGAQADATQPGFFGVVPQGRLSAPDFGQMAGTIGTLRVGVLWSQVEPRPGEFELAGLDTMVSSAAEAGIRVLPCVYTTPSWLSPDEVRPPIGSQVERRAWSEFLRALARRYGPRGSFWAGRAGPALPIREWQIWNEPNFVLFWHPRPSPEDYVHLLRDSGNAIRSVDPAAKIVAAGLAPITAGIMPTRYLKRMYEVPGARRAFDVAAIHPYATAPFGVEYYVRHARHVMAEAGDGGKPLLVSELGVASSAERPTAFDKGLMGQAEFLRRSYSLLLRNRHRWRIAGVDWFTWRDGTSPDEHCAFCEYAGLFDAADQPKPAWFALQRIVAAAVR